MLKITERVASTHLGIKKSDYRPADKYMGQYLQPGEVEGELKEGKMVLIKADVPLNVRQAVALVEINPELYEAGFCSFQRVVSNQEYTPAVRIKLKKDVDLDDLGYLFKVHVNEAWR